MGNTFDMHYFSLRRAVATLFFSLTFSSLALAQGFTYNTTLYGQRLYPNNRGSGCWGYSDTVIVNGQPRLRELAFFGCFRGTSIVDITTPQLREIAFIPTQSTSPTHSGNDWREIRTSGRYAYITTEATGGGLQIVDLLPDPNNPDSVRLVRKFDTGGTNNQHNIGTSAGYAWEADNYIYLCGGQVTLGFGNSGGMAIYDVSNPTNPVLMSRYATRYVHDVYVKNDTAYLANINDGFVDIVNVSNKSNPVRIRTFTYPAPNIGDAGTHNVWVTEDSKFIFTTDEVAPSGHNILRVHDARDYNNIIVNAATYKSPVGSQTAVVHNAYVRGKHIIMSYYTQGVKIVDISEPLDPVEVGAYNTYGSTTASGYNGCWGVFPFYPSGKIIASDINTATNSNTGKLSVIQFNNARAGIVRGTVRSATTNQVIAGAQIRAIDYYNKTRTSNSAGFYRIRTVQGSNKRFVVSAAGYRADTLVVNVPENGDSITVDVNLQPLTSDTQISQRPEGYTLYQNYPNPFNPTTIISYQLEVPSVVKLELFDVMGRKLATLVDAKQGAGLHQYTLNATQLALSSGTYFYRLTANGFTDTKRMMLLK
jgi:choice-of-anchor B domain-containing protein